MADRSAYPLVQRIQDLDAIVESKTSTRQYTTFYKFTSDDVAFFGLIEKPKADISLDEYAPALERVPDHHIFPAVSSEEDWTIATHDTDVSLFVKQPMMSQYELFKDEDEPVLAQILLDEALILERLARYPHRNIIRYLGIRVRRDRMMGLVLEKHQRTLSDHVKQGLEIEENTFFLTLVSAVDHLHSLDLAHNDLNPENIMVNTDCMPVIIDFGSCQPFGKRLLSCGTPEWIEDMSIWSDKKHDIGALNKIKEWFKSPWYD